MPKVYIREDRQTDAIAIDNALRKLKKQVEKLGILKKLHEKERYEKPTLKRKRKRSAAKMRWKRELEAQQLPEKKY